MKKQLITIFMLFATLAMSAQDKVLDKYSAMGDVSTTAVTRGMLDKMPEEQLNLLAGGAMKDFADKIQSIKILSSDKPKAAKQLSQKLPKQLMSSGYAEVTTTQQGSARVQILRSKTDPNSMVFVITDGDKATVASMKGNFVEQY